MQQNSSKKLIILSNSGGYGGAPRFVEQLIPTLSRSMEVHVFAEHPLHLEALRRLHAPQLHVYALTKGRTVLQVLSNALRLWKQFRRIRPTHVLSNTNKAALFLGLLYRSGALRNAKKLVFVHDYQWVNAKLIWKLLGRTPLLVPTKALFDKPNYMPDWPVIEIPNSIQVEEPPIHSTRKPPTVLSLAMISPWKGLEYLLQAFLIAKKKAPDIQLEIMGKVVQQSYFDSLVQFVKEHGLEACVQFKPYTHDVTPHYKSAQLIVSSSISELGGPETFGRTIIEAWAVGKPVVAFQNGGPRFVIDHGINGYLVPEKNVEELGARIAELANSPELCQQMGLAGYQKVLETYTPEIVAAKLIQAMDSL